MKKWALFLMLSVSAWGDDLGELRRLLGRSLVSARIVEDWAVCDLQVLVDGRKEAEGMGLYHRVNGSWQQVTAGGGAFGADVAGPLGVPRRLWEPLKIDVSARQAAEILGKPSWPETSKRVLDPSWIKDKSGWERMLMRNEIFARHGHVFKDPELRAYFAQRSWYHPGKETALTAIEKRNVQMLLP